VRDIIVKASIAALLVALAPGLASAAGLGRLTVLSALGHPFSAEIELVSVSKAEMGSLSAQIAPPEAYRKANLQYNSALPGARVTIEKRPDGRPYLKITTSRPVTEPFIDLMIDLTWSAGRILREYTALLDPPGVGAMPLGEPAPTVSATPEMRPAPMTSEAPAAPLAPASPAMQVAPEPPVSAPMSQPIAPAPTAEATAGAKEYGPIERGETLGKIARSVMPEGVTLEQMLVALYRANEEAFIRKNLNLVRAGKILRVPDREEVESISNGEAVKVYRAHVTDWRAYRQRLADAAGKTSASSRSAASGKIVAKVEEPASETPKEVVKISKGEPPASGAGATTPRSTAERIRALEEEVVAREKALAEANERIVQLEKTIKDMQKLIALKNSGMATAQQQAQEAAPAPAPAPEVSAAPKPQAAQPAPQKPRVVAKPEPPKQKPKPKPKVVTSPPPSSQPELMDQVMGALGDPMYLAAGSGVLVLGGLALWMARRRRSREALDAGISRESPTLGSAAAAAAGVVASTDDMDSAAAPGTTAMAAASDDVDPLAEAEVYIAYGRDGQAEEILKEALARAPNRADVKLKLLEIYAARKDKMAFGQLASDVQKQIGGSGGDWLKVAAMGYAFDPDNKLYAAGRGAEVPAPSGPRTGQNIDFDLGIGAGAGLTTTDIELGSEAAAAVQAATQTVVDTGMATDVERARRAAEAPAMPDFRLDVPPVDEAHEDANVKIEAAAEPARDAGTIDFQIELPPAGAAIHELPTVKDATSPGGADFKLELPEGGLDLGSKPATTTVQGVATTKDGHWYDVQTKFDLAKAYQEMGDKAGAKEILQEVISEGDADQKSQAKALLDSLG
jgi:pilus assembly protein FimV